jgi:formate dehydrogenase iron-sulfur subunit
MTAVKIYVPRDAAALSVGADEVAAAIAQQARKAGVEVELVRNGSRGMMWLEPLVEVATAQGRIAYGPVAAVDVPALFAAGFQNGGAHALRHGPTEEIPFFKNQQRLTFARVGVVDPRSLDDYEAHGGLRGLRAALASTPANLVDEVMKSGLRGRGGAAFPAGIKWKTVAQQPAGQKYVVCNADEGDSGTFSDRMVIEGDPFLLIEGMVIAGIACGADQGFIYLRSEYPDAEVALTAAIAAARTRGLLGPSVLGSSHAFELHLRRGAGAYICGEETAMLESLEGKRGMVRPKPPLPAIAGLFGRPSLIHNVMSLAAVPLIAEKGGAFYAAYGMGRSKGTLPFQLAGNVKRGGLVERAFGLTLRELLYDFGGGSASGRPIRAVQVGGPLGAYLPASKFDTPLDYEAFAAVGGMIGHGGVVAFDDTVDMSAMARYAMEFCAVESCGKCTPCRIGSTRGVEVIDKIKNGQQSNGQQSNGQQSNGQQSNGQQSNGQQVQQQIALLRDLCDTMTHASLCAMGGLTPAPVLSALENFPEDFAAGAARSRT